MEKTNSVQNFSFIAHSSNDLEEEQICLLPNAQDRWSKWPAQNKVHKSFAAL